MTDPVTVGLIAAIPATIAALAALWATVKGNRKVDSIKVDIDGRLSQLLESVSKEQHALGRSEGVESERTRKP